MADEGQPSEATDDLLLDVSDISLSDLLADGDDVLAHAIRRRIKEVDRQVEAISGWSSYVDGTGPDG
jgi:hypothetical protein